MPGWAVGSEQVRSPVLPGTRSPNRIRDTHNVPLRHKGSCACAGELILTRAPWLTPKSPPLARTSKDREPARSLLPSRKRSTFDGSVAKCSPRSAGIEPTADDRLRRGWRRRSAETPTLAIVYEQHTDATHPAAGGRDRAPLLSRDPACGGPGWRRRSGIKREPRVGTSARSARAPGLMIFVLVSSVILLRREDTVPHAASSVNR
jgi:hypothetical protein